jgi:hypothetical protein
MEEIIVYLVLPGFFIWGAIKVLAELFKFFIKTMKFIGALLVAVIPVVALAYISNLFFGMTPFEIGIQTIGTEATLSIIAYNMFGNVNDGKGLDMNE